MLINERFHLTYCTNIHPGQDWKSTFASLQKYLPAIKKKLSPEQNFGVGLRLSNKASQELQEGIRLEMFKDWLAANNLYVFTMNGFPHGNFHKEEVKDKVYLPDWASEERVSYTLRLFDQLAALIPTGLSGGISTSPISYKPWYPLEGSRQLIFRKAAQNLVRVVAHLHKLESTTGTYLHLDIEPEPDCFLENSDEFLYFYESYLLPAAQEILGRKSHLNEEIITGLVKRYITLCYDVCHFALAYEEPAETFKKMQEAGISIGKIQVSAALKIAFDGTNDKAVWQSLAQFNEPVYLHQVTEKTENGVRTYHDLPEVLAIKKKVKELRAHFHVPIFLDTFEALQSTQDHVIKVIEYIRENAITEHVEVETYTWEVLPKSLKKELSDSIVRELQWLYEKLM